MAHVASHLHGMASTGTLAKPCALPSAAVSVPHRRINSTRCQRLQAAPDDAGPSNALSEKDVQSLTFDPEGLLGSKPTGGHFERRQRERAAPLPLPSAQQQQDAGGSLPAPRPIPPELLASGGIPADADVPGVYDKAAFGRELSERYVALDLDHPGLRVLHFEPPVLTCDAFFSAEECASLIDAAQRSGRMEASRVGAGYVAGGDAGSGLNPRRTSTSVLLQPEVLAADPNLREMAELLQSRGQRLMCAPDPWGAPGRLPAHGQVCYEALQVAKYEPGQFFLSHEDAFPLPTALDNGFQRRATLLIYLNDVPQGGSTHFESLGLSIRPAAGKALLFFPGLSDGRPDPRTLHTAQEAVDTKWVTQQWVASGLAPAEARPLAGLSTGLGGDVLRDLGLSPIRAGNAAANAGQQQQHRVPPRAEEPPPQIEKLLGSKKGKAKGSKAKPAKKGFGAR